MLTIQDLTYRIQTRALFEGASAQIPDGWKVGLVGRNGTGKSTLLRLIQTEAAAGSEAIRLKSGARIGVVEQEIEASSRPLLEVVLEADTERAALMAQLETEEDGEAIAEAHTRLADIDAWSAEARAARVLAGLGFSQADLERAAGEFSGGWRMRAALAGVLFSTPDLLLLDEPTNYLDLEGASWLEGYLRKYPRTLIIVSHDRDLLNRSVSHILAVEDTKLVMSTGGYDDYLKGRAERQAHLVSMKAKQDAQRAHLQSFVDRFRAKATKARQAQSRLKMIERMQDIAVPLSERTTPFTFPNPEQLASPILRLEDSELGYVEGRPILSGVELRLDVDDRIAIVGANGQGKTTLVKSIAERLPLMTGKRIASSKLRIGYFSQDQLDELSAGDSVLQHVQALAPEMGQSKARALAAQFGFGAEKVETLVEKLSGGEKVRLLLGLTTYSKPHILILDEPTSHLDIDSREALIHALNDYEGAVLLITHDTYLAEGASDQIWLVKDGEVSPYDGDISDYRAMVMAADRETGSGGGGRTGPGSSYRAPETKHEPVVAVQAEAEPPRRKPNNKERERVKRAEAALGEAQAKLAALDAALGAPDAFADPEYGQKLSRERGEWADKLESAELEWLEANEVIEGLGG